MFRLSYNSFIIKSDFQNYKIRILTLCYFELFKLYLIQLIEIKIIH